MTTPAVLKAADLNRMGAFVRKNPGMRVEVEKDGILIRVAPDIPANHRVVPVDDIEEYRL